jgi:site-specific recombinase XerD
MEAFLREHLVRHRGASQHTCDSYAYTFQSLFEFAAGKIKVAPSALMLEQLDATLVSGFLEHLETTRGNSAETRNIRLAAIRSFFRFLQHREPAAIEQVRRVLAIPFKKTDTRFAPSSQNIRQRTHSASQFDPHPSAILSGSPPKRDTLSAPLPSRSTS